MIAMSDVKTITRRSPFWHRMTLDQKRQWLIDDGQAKTWKDACSLLGRSGGSVTRFRARMIRQHRNACGMTDVKELFLIVAVLLVFVSVMAAIAAVVNARTAPMIFDFYFQFHQAFLA